LALPKAGKPLLPGERAVPFENTKDKSLPLDGGGRARRRRVKVGVMNFEERSFHILPLQKREAFVVFAPPLFDKER
jgi:hypothetical protein